MSTEKIPVAPAAGKKYAFKNGAKSMRPPGYGNLDVTVDHLNGPDSAVFIKALKKVKHGDKPWFDEFVIEVNG